ncbi:AraC-type DNA-binding protein [Ekhidna lutea]|uniref:AraC-type DNA-binding protein n=1 Tax=Ekhidna lutea TaxID=447679 RepID=A0A239EJV1_EKHLU|nr:helix-turn-helix domain-containing protein [Ekhidna lutea]SNS44134.1 AraC-type DNA-binding protein [Ekhidna lutea]
MNPGQLYTGIYLCILIQVCLMGLINVYQKKLQNRILGIICFLFAISIVKIAYWEPIQGTTFSMIFGGPHLFLFPPMLYVYLRSLSKERNTELLIHLFVPIVAYLIIRPIRIAVLGWPSDSFSEVIYHELILIAIMIFYHLKCGKIIKYDLNRQLKSRLVGRFKRFYYSMYLYLIVSTLFLLPLSFNYHYQLPALTDLNYNYVFPAYLFSFRYLFMIPCMFFIFYSLTEVSWMKRLFISAAIEEKRMDNDVEFLEIHRLLNSSDFYTNPNLNVEMFLKDSNIPRATLKAFLSENGYSNFNEMINTFRVNAFKRMVSQAENQKYDLFSLAREAGFNSKASFFRVFKQLEGVTPNQYHRSNIHKS